MEQRADSGLGEDAANVEHTDSGGVLRCVLDDGTECPGASSAQVSFWADRMLEEFARPTFLEAMLLPPQPLTRTERFLRRWQSGRRAFKDMPSRFRDAWLVLTGKASVDE